MKETILEIAQMIMGAVGAFISTVLLPAMYKWWKDKRHREVLVEIFWEVEGTGKLEGLNAEEKYLMAKDRLSERIGDKINETMIHAAKSLWSKMSADEQARSLRPRRILRRRKVRRLKQKPR